MLAKYHPTEYDPPMLERVVACPHCARKTRAPLARVLLTGHQPCIYCGDSHVLTAEEISEALGILGIADDGHYAPLHPREVIMPALLTRTGTLGGG